MMTYDCGHIGRRIDTSKIDVELYHEWLSKKATVCFDCFMNERVSKAIEKADAEHCAALEKENVAALEGSHV